jgi:chromosomal replication initiator protein
MTSFGVVENYFCIKTNIMKKDESTPKAECIKVNTNYTFDNFIECESNKIAFHCAKNISQNPLSSLYNPFVIYGGVATGKTHLVHAVWNEIERNKPDIQVTYISAFSFYFQFIESIRNNNNNEFLASFLNTDVLILEDLHHIDNMEKTQDNLLHIIEMLSDKQIIVTSKMKLNQFSTFNAQLASRLSGVFVNILGYNSEIKFEILKQNAKLNQLMISEQVIKELAEIEELDIRQSEGALSSLALDTLFTKEEIDPSNVKAFYDKFYNPFKKD